MEVSYTFASSQNNSFIIRPTHNNNMSRPTGTISTMAKNLRTEFKAAFRR